MKEKETAPVRAHKDMKEKCFALVRAHKELSLFIGLALLSLIFSQCGSSKKEPAAVGQEPPIEMATYIPAGHSLVPLEIANYQTLDSIFGPFGVVDLYVQDATANNFSRFVAKNVKLVRAPKNPSHFAALVPASEIPKIMRFAGPFFAVVQNPNTSGTQFEKEKVRSRSRIQYNLGE